MATTDKFREIYNSTPLSKGGKTSNKGTIKFHVPLYSIISVSKSGKTGR